MADTELIIEWEDESSVLLDPYAEQKAYFAKVELRRQQKIIEQRENYDGKSIFELSRQR